MSGYRRLIFKTQISKSKQAVNKVDWQLLVFLLLFLNVKLVVKLAAIVWIYFVRNEFNFGFRFQRSRLPLFYLFIIAIGIIDYFLFHGTRSFDYSIVVMTGIGFWVVSILAVHQLKHSVELHSPGVIDQTLAVFFKINAAISLAALLIIIIKTGTINPYLYQGEYQKYFIGTGDYIKGISFDTSTTNAVLNAFGVIYFLTHRNAFMIFLCMSVLLLTGSNITNGILCIALLYVFIFQSDRDQKSLILVCFFLLVVFMAKISPQNNQYVSKSLSHLLHLSAPSKPSITGVISLENMPDTSLSEEERKQKIALLYLDSTWSTKRTQHSSHHNTSIHRANYILPQDNINGPEFQHKSVITASEEKSIQFIIENSGHLPMSSDTMYHPEYPGKIIAWQQTYHYLAKNPIKAFTGTGMGNFSSKVAFKAAGLGIAGSWLPQHKYINNAFLENHLDTYLYFFSKSDGFHSVINNPGSVYDQLIAEYGIIGFGVFLIFYLGFFLSKLPHLTYGRPLLIMICGIFFFDYWFEQLSVVAVFELFMFLNLKESQLNNES